MPEALSSLPVRPRIKPIYEVLYLDGRVHLGTGADYAFEIEDDTGCYAKLVKALDGSLTVEELQESLAVLLDREEVIDGLRVLYEQGFLEDAAEPPPPELSPEETRRYGPNLNFFRAISPPGSSCYAPQVALKRTRVTILGLGGIGSNVAMALAELGVGHVAAVDFDRVDLSNLNRQVLYSTPAVGLPKAAVAQQRMKEFNPDISFTADERRITCPADVQAIVDDSAPDFLFCLADRPNGYIDFWTNEVCVRRRIPYAAASIGCQIGRAYSVLPGEGPCYQCRVDAETDDAPAMAEVLNYIREHEINASNGALGPACMLLAYFLSYEMLRHRLGLGPMLAADRLLEIDFISFEQRWHQFSRRSDCPVCGDPRRYADAG